MIWIFLRYRNKIANIFIRRISTLIVLTVALYFGYLVSSLFSGLDEKSQFKTDNLITSVNITQLNFEANQGEGSGSNFKSYKAASLTDLFIGIPLGLINTYFRPFFWDIKSPIAILSALESFGFLTLFFYCIRRIGLRLFFQTIFSDSLITFCLGYAVLFGGIIGLTTTNFGALSRYKTPCITFFMMGIILIMDKFPVFSKKYIFSRRLF
jgi:hypothetical protein